MNEKEKRKYFEKFKKKFLYVKELYPIEIRCTFYPYGILVRTEYENRDFDIDFDFPIPEMIIKITESLKDLFPKFSHKRIEKIEYTSEEIKKLLKEDKSLSLLDTINLKKDIEVIENYCVLKVYSKRRQFVLEENGIKYRYNYSKKIKDFKKQLAEIKELGDSKLYIFIFSNCWLDKKYEDNFPLNIKYTGKQLENFILLNRNKIEGRIIYRRSKGYHEWGRFRLFFQSKEDRKKSLNLLK